MRPAYHKMNRGFRPWAGSLTRPGSLSKILDEPGQELDYRPFSVSLRFFCKHIWRKWDEEDGDDDFDYFVRCVEPRLRL